MKELPPEGCHHYQSLDEVAPEVQKYWHQRHDIFSGYDNGIWMTDSAWFGVTPEPIAIKIAEHMSQSTPAERDIVVDAFAGVGANAIAFARSGRWKRVIAIEKDARAFQCAQHNAKIYGVYDSIEWHQGDCIELLSNMDDLEGNAAIFGSPPWGGPSYRSEKVFNLATMEPYSVDQLYAAFSTITDDVVLYLPRSSDLRQLASLIPDDKQMRVVHYCMYGASKALCVYLGDAHNY